MPNDNLMVFGDDGSDAATAAWQWINDQPWPGWRVDVVTATDPEVGPATDPPRSETPRPWTPDTPRVTSERSYLGPPTHLCVDADPRLALAQRDDASLLVIGRGDLGRRFARLLGSTAAWLVQHPPAPLAIVDEPGPVRRVLVCADGSAGSAHAAEQLVALPLVASADITLLSVYDGWADPASALERAAKTFADAGLSVTADEQAGKAVPTILEVAHDRDIDLIVLGRRGLSGWDWLRIGSTAAGVAHHAPCTVFIGGAHPR